MFWSIVISVLAGAIAMAYYYATCNYDYWKKRNFPYVKPTLPFGNYSSIFFLKKHMNLATHTICEAFPKEPLIGGFLGQTPVLVVRDPEYIKTVTTKDFYFYSSRGLDGHEDIEFFNNNVFSSYGDYWKTLRQNLTPIFSTAKMKNMFYLIQNCSQSFEKMIDEEVKSSSNVEVQRLMARFTIACIVSCAFGVDSETMGKEYKTNPFIQAGDMIFNNTKARAWSTYMRMTWPKIFYGIGLRTMPVKMIDMFYEFMTSVFKARNYKPTSRNDFVDFILGFKEKEYITGDGITNPRTGETKKTSVEVTDELLVANCLVFFLAGFETSATTSSNTLYELAKHPEVQKRLHKEIDEYLLKTGNKVEYESIVELPYLQACVDEALRLYPVFGVNIKMVVEDVTLGPVQLTKGVYIHIPTYTIHRDPKYFPEPELYRPERFLGDNKQKILPHTYMPFGDGPRLCLGMRFARMQMTAGLVTVLKKYKLELAPGAPRKFDWCPRRGLLPAPTRPHTLKFTVREGWETTS